MPGPDKKTRNFVFTLNNPTPEDEEQLRALTEDCKYIVYGREHQGPRPDDVPADDPWTPHYQGFCSFKSQRYIGGVLKTFLKRAHWEVAITVQQAIDYCKKDGDFTEHGTKPMTPVEKGRKQKADWTGICDAACDGRVDEIRDSYPQIYALNFEKFDKLALRFSVAPEDLEEPNAYWYCGVSGGGKSYAARQDFPGAYLKACNKNWDNYRGQENVIVEEFSKQHAEHLAHYLKQWCDRYVFQGDVKYSHTGLIRPKAICVTSNWHPKDLFTDPNDLEPILRRFKIKEFKHKYGEEPAMEPVFRSLEDRLQDREVDRRVVQVLAATYKPTARPNVYEGAWGPVPM